MSPTSPDSSNGLNVVGRQGRARSTASHLRRYLAYLATRRYARASIARKAAALRCYFAWLSGPGHSETTRLDGLGLRLVHPGLPRVLERAEIATILDYQPRVHRIRKRRTSGCGGGPGPRRARAAYTAVGSESPNCAGWIWAIWT